MSIGGNRLPTVEGIVAAVMGPALPCPDIHPGDREVIHLRRARETGGAGEEEKGVERRG